jgi:hypothetical protein
MSPPANGDFFGNELVSLPERDAGEERLLWGMRAVRAAKSEWRL